MAEQDRGQCGYDCQDYSDAIVSKKEERLNPCVPAGKETTRMVKALYKVLDSSSPSPAVKAPTPTPAAATAAPVALASEASGQRGNSSEVRAHSASEDARKRADDTRPEPGSSARAAAPGCSRASPAEARFLSRTGLNRAGSEKETWHKETRHIEFDLKGTGAYMAAKAPRRSWLFFGGQRRDCDFFYEDELTGMKAAGALAWSRDGTEKIYVQDRMREVGRDLRAWLAEGAHVYLCGDAKRAARDVEGEIVAKPGARTTGEATAFVAGLKKSGRYQQDVYR